MCERCEETLDAHGQARRKLIVAGASAGALLMAPAAACAARPRTLDLYHTHTGEKLRVTYAEGGIHLPDALAEISHFLRDFRTGDSHPIDPKTLHLEGEFPEAEGSILLEALKRATDERKLDPETGEILDRRTRCTSDPESVKAQAASAFDIPGLLLIRACT